MTKRFDVGIRAKDFEALALKHYTSKIEAFEDLETVRSYGFRGEALSSICQLSGQLSIWTRHEQESMGTYLIFDPTGKVHSQVRTTVH